jgi:NTP pyrophosphatase (non-canonical NTP hydrolase)
MSILTQLVYGEAPITKEDIEKRELANILQTIVELEVEVTELTSSLPETVQDKIQDNLADIKSLANSLIVKYLTSIRASQDATDET